MTGETSPCHLGIAFRQYLCYTTDGQFKYARSRSLYRVGRLRLRERL
ncbi:MAG: hypothetical protein WAQ32_02330 [Dethiobacteria bacterium]|nr:hypothetical protein [Bacillota bacterium]NMD33269.1 hypothetical protein [Bacillota bacterium]HOB29409.1 hypothetical protein [Bacillota bacterium]HPZ41996.1 hypothetical protein [Bacillota bacterium]HQD52899.1 hypothetical protein [Bacillota bacterium]